MDLTKKAQTRSQAVKIVYAPGSYGHEKKKGLLHKQAWSLVSEIVRRSEADRYGVTHCYTCGKPWHWKDTDCGHFLHAGTSHLNLVDFCFDNLRVQCKHCNKYLKGNLDIYRANLESEIGPERIQDIYDLKNVINKWSHEEYKKLIADLKIELKELDNV